MPGTRLSGKVAFITGGASGIGLSIAETFLHEGASVFVIDYSASNISTSKTTLSQKFPEENFIFAEGDAADEGTVKSLVEQCVTRFGALDIGILNAGVFPPSKPVLEVDTEEYERVMRINAFGPFIGLKTISQKMISLGTKGGSIISTCSAAGLRPGRDMAVYAMAKFAVRGLTIAAGQELAEFGIRVNAVCPGIIDTVLAENLRGKEKMVLGCPMKRYGGTEEIAKVFLFLASDEASFVTSSLYKVDGGLVNS